MRMRRLTAVICTAAVLLSGCTSLSLNGHDILAPPKAAGSRAELQKLIEKDAGGSYSLITPVSGDNKSSVINHDFDNDGNDEAVAMYTAADGTSRVLAAAARGSSYSLIGSSELSSANISSVSFADVNADAADELIVSCDAGSQAATLSVFFPSEEMTSVKAAGGFSGYAAGDLDKDNAADITVFIPASAKATARAAMLTYSDGGFTEAASCEVDPAVEAYAHLSYSGISNGQYGIAADGVNENGEYSTQLIYYDSAAKSLINPLFIYAGYDKTIRTSKIFATATESDGIVKIPYCEPMKHTKDEDITKVCTAVQWNRYDPAQLTAVPSGEAVLCDAMGFMLMLKDDTLDKVTARCADRSSMTLYSAKDDEKSVLGKALLTINYSDKGEFDSGSDFVLYESGTGVYTCELSGDSEYSFDDIKNSFRPTNYE